MGVAWMRQITREDVFAKGVCGQSGMQLLMQLLLACAGFRPLYKVLRRDMNSRETLFAGLAGLRGSVSLILAQAVITEDKGGDSTSQVGKTIREEMEKSRGCRHESTKLCIEVAHHIM